MPIMRAQVVFQGKTNKPEDVYVNTFHFSTQGSTVADVDVIRDHLIELYNTTPPLAGSFKIADLLSNTVSRATGASKIKIYIVAPGPVVSPVVDPNPPLRTESWTLAAPQSSTGNELPPEMAICASFYAGQNTPRYRGRVYLGPWQISTQDIAVTEQSQPSGPLRTSIASAFGRLVAKPANTQNLAVYSRVDGIARPVTAGWVDDAWDVQRRRGHAPTMRTLFP